jgi:hypothetical protein
VQADSPGLEVWDRHGRFWFPIEKTFKTPAASVLVGRQLERLSNGLYPAAGHLVRAYSDESTPATSTDTRDVSRYRYSIVFVLRAHYPVPINTDELTTCITGPFYDPMKGITANDLFRELHQAHFNINTGIEERNKQKQTLAEKKARAS